MGPGSYFSLCKDIRDRHNLPWLDGDLIAAMYGCKNVVFFSLSLLYLPNLKIFTSSADRPHRSHLITFLPSFESLHALPNLRTVNLAEPSYEGPPTAVAEFDWVARFTSMPSVRSIRVGELVESKLGRELCVKGYSSDLSDLTVVHQSHDIASLDNLLGPVRALKRFQIRTLSGANQPCRFNLHDLSYYTHDTLEELLFTTLWHGDHLAPLRSFQVLHTLTLEIHHGLWRERQQVDFAKTLPLSLRHLKLYDGSVTGSPARAIVHYLHDISKIFASGSSSALPNLQILEFHTPEGILEDHKCRRLATEIEEQAAAVNVCAIINFEGEQLTVDCNGYTDKRYTL